MSDQTPPRQPVRLAGFNVVELVGGAVMSLTGVAAAVAASTYGLGTARAVGPGLFPLCLGVVLAVMGVAVIFEGRTSTALPPKVPWRPILSITAGLIAYGLFVERLGAFAAVVALIVCAGFAEPRFRPGSTLGVALACCAFMAALAWAFWGAITIRLLPEF